MSFYLYRQNNTHGVFTGPAVIYIVEADTAEEANETALQDIYFDGKDVDDDGNMVEVDCDCCGNRWERASEDALKYESIDDPEIVMMEERLERFAQQAQLQCTLIVHKNPIEGITGEDVERIPWAEFEAPLVEE